MSWCEGAGWPRLLGLAITAAIAGAVSVPVIASGGAGAIEHVADAFNAGAYAAIISSLLYSPRLESHLTVGEIKSALTTMGVTVRPWGDDS